MVFILWILIFLGALILEMATATSLVSIWFCVGALCALAAAALQLSFLWQSVIFFAASLLCLAAIRPMAAGYLRGNTIATNADRVIGSRTRLLKGIRSDGWGEVKINGVIWNAASSDGHPIAQQSLIEVVAVEGAKLIVRKIGD